MVMDDKIILGIIPSLNNAESLINNLVEADYSEDNISLVSQDTETARKIIDDSGPLEGSDMDNISQYLSGFGLPQDEIDVYRQALASGKSLISLSCPPPSAGAAVEIFNDYDCEAVITI